MTTDSPATKQCPYCAETILKAAIKCRYCGSDLAATAQPPAPTAQSTSPDDRALMQQEITRLTSQGWQVVSQTETTAQVKKPKEWNKAGVILFVFLPILGALFYGPLLWLALLGLVLIVADYLVKKEQLVFVTVEQLRKSGAEAQHRKEQPFVETVEYGKTACSACGEYVRADATTCKHCGVTFTPAPTS